MHEEHTASPPLSHVVVPLLKGPIYRDRQVETWERLLREKDAVGEYLTTLGLTIFVDENEGYAFVRQMEFDDEEHPPPKLIQRRPLSFPVSVLCLILRQWLLEHDTQGGELRAIIEKRQIREELALFLPQSGSEAKREDALNRHINRAVELGLLKALKDDDQRFEIQRITKALINADWLGDMEQKLAEFKQHASDTA